MSIKMVTLPYWLPVLFLVMSHEYQYISGQHNLWLVPLPHSNSIQNTFSYRSHPQGQHSRRADTRNGIFLFENNFYSQNQIHDQSYIEPFYRRSTPNVLPSPPQIHHLLIKEYGSASDSSDTIWQQYDLKRKNKAREESAETGSLFYKNQKEALVHVHENEIVRMNDENHDSASSSNSASNGSGSTEFSLIHYPPNSSFENDTPEIVSQTVVDGNVRCIQPNLEGNQVRYDPVTGRCFAVGTKGPCGNWMLFMAVPGDNFNGFCDCDQDSFDRPLVLVGGQCHFLYSQAVCYPGYWLTSVTPALEPVCELNPCHNSQARSNTNTLVPFKGECVSLNSPNRHCGREGEVVYFPKGSVKPICGFHPKSKKRIYRRQISSVRAFRCRPGQTRHRVTKKCVRQTKMYFL